MSGFFCTRAGIQAHRPIRMPRSIRGFFFALIMALGTAHPVLAQGTRVQTPYANPKAIVDVYLDHPAKMGAALYWVRSLVNPLTEAPYSLFPEDMSIIVLLHGTELVTVARKNEAIYEELVQRMRYYASQGVKFKVCGLALQDYGYTDAEPKLYSKPKIPSPPKNNDWLTLPACAPKPYTTYKSGKKSSE